MLDFKVAGKIRRNVCSKRFTWMRTKGNINTVFYPISHEDLSTFFLQFGNKEKLVVIGAGSNTLFQNSEFEGVLIRLGKEFNYIKDGGDRISVGAGTLDYHLAMYAKEHVIGEFEFFSGIPGTIGGAIAMNAGAYGSETCDNLLSVTAMNYAGEIRVFSKDDMKFQYRSNGLEGDWIFLEATFKKTAGDKREISDKIDYIREQRTSTQPINEPTCGSTFKNTERINAWKLIYEAGCRGMKYGGAKVSEKHCNFIVNEGTATPEDVIILINSIKKKVFTHTGIMLEEEVQIVSI